MGSGTAATAFAIACGGDDKSPSQQAASGTATGGDHRRPGAGGAAQALLPGQLSDAENQAKTVEVEYRLKYHYSKLQNLPGQKQGPKNGGIFARPGAAGQLGHARPHQRGHARDYLQRH